MFSNHSQDYGVYFIGYGYVDVIVSLRSCERLAQWKSYTCKDCGLIHRLRACDLLLEHVDDVVDTGIGTVDGDLVAMYLGYYDD